MNLDYHKDGVCSLIFSWFYKIPPIPSLTHKKCFGSNKSQKATYKLKPSSLADDQLKGDACLRSFSLLVKNVKHNKVLSYIIVLFMCCKSVFFLFWLISCSSLDRPSLSTHCSMCFSFKMQRISHNSSSKNYKKSFCLKNKGKEINAGLKLLHIFLHIYSDIVSTYHNSSFLCCLRHVLWHIHGDNCLLLVEVTLSLMEKPKNQVSVHTSHHIFESNFTWTSSEQEEDTVWWKSIW